jgi:hypothetical protein
MRWRDPETQKYQVESNTVRNLEQTVTAALALFKIVLYLSLEKTNVVDINTPVITLHHTCFNTTAISSGVVPKFTGSVIPFDYNK